MCGTWIASMGGDRIATTSGCRRCPVNKKLKVAVVSSGRPQFEIAVAAGMSETKLSRIVRGRASPTEEEALRIARALEQPPEHLFGTPQRRRRPGGAP